MLRALVALLLLLNLLFFGWSHGWLDGLLGLRAGGDREPERLRLESHAERLSLLSPQAVSALQTRSCLESPPLAGEEALQAAQLALQHLGLTAADWSVQRSEQPGVWAVATIKLGTPEFRARKEETYRQLRIAYEPLPGLPEEQPSLLLSRHASAAAAEAALEAFSRRALKGLRVLQLQAPQTRYSLQLPHADGNQQALLQAPREAALAPGFKPCSTAAAAGAAPASAASSSSNATP